VERFESDNDFGSYVYSHSSAESDSFFTIETSVELLSLLVFHLEDLPGLMVEWNTNPGPEDLDGYRLEKRRNADNYFPLVSRTTETSYHDANGRVGDSYRLFAINGLGEEFFLGEASSDRTPSLRDGLAAYPVPFRGGELSIVFATTVVGGEAAITEVAIYDVTGRRIKTVAQGRYDSSAHRVAWDGTDQNGYLVSSGTYFIRVHSGQTVHTRKVILVR
ncbi:MAG: T9SS type A sorting domain-containing protein, partial [bacterium]